VINANLSQPSDRAIVAPPRLSIVTIMRNAREGFARTGESVISSLPTWCEWIVIDGGSTDGTLDEVPRFRPFMRCFLSEPDDGIADAFNKGVARSRGEYVLFLNAGDTLMPDFYKTIGPLLEADDRAPAIIGKIMMSGQVFGKRVSFFQQWGRNYLPHQAMLVRRSLFRMLGGFDTNFRLGMDYEWSLRLRNRWKDIHFVPYPLSEMEPGGASIVNYRETFASYHRARMKHCGYRLPSKALELFFVQKVRIGKILRSLVMIQRVKRNTIM
jgi:glycosyltransferase involved in cell wall biosynthesis